MRCADGICLELCYEVTIAENEGWNNEGKALNNVSLNSTNSSSATLFRATEKGGRAMDFR